MFHVTQEEFIAFILAQPEDRPVNVADFHSTDPCGCPMVHYGKEVLGLTEFNASSYDLYKGNGPCLAKINGGNLKDKLGRKNCSNLGVITYGNLRANMREEKLIS